MTEIIFNLIIGSMAIAGTAVLWRNVLEDHPNLKKNIVNRIHYGHKVLTCGSCFTYWLALFYTLTARPFISWTPFNNSSELWYINIFIQWMALAWLSVFLRFLYVLIQELVSYQVHNKRHHH